MTSSSSLPSSSKSPPLVQIAYSIVNSSEHSGKYVAENIRVDCPADQTSRWSGAQPMQNMKHVHHPKQIRLRLLVAEVITFGKFHKPHPCNMKEFRLYAGMTEEHMTEVLHAGLKNDSVSEHFQVKHSNAAGFMFPTRYVKIVPLSAHGQSFHTSIWYVALSGVTEETYLERIQAIYDEHRETTALRHILKHLRQRRLLTPYNAILARSGLKLEHPLVTKLHHHIVLQGNWSSSEEILQRISQAGLFDDYLRACQPRAIWKRLHGVNADGDTPGKRGGHAMCIDHENAVIYLFGGWDGQKSLDDFWSYSIRTDQWRLLSPCTSKEKNGPGARSCHKMVYDTKTGCIYVLGRLADKDEVKQSEDTGSDAAQQAESVGMSIAPRQSLFETGDGSTPTAVCSEFYRYHTRGLDAGKWDLLSFDTASDGGPPLIFDHQMVIDCEAQILYVSGGRIVDGDWNSLKFSGLYSYNVRLSKWKILQPSDSVNNPAQTSIPSRFGHSMVLDPSFRVLYIFAGQRDNKYLSDMYAYDIATNNVTELYSNFSTSGGPDACFTQRAVIDPALKELYVFCGLTRKQQAGSETTLQSKAQNWAYRYDTQPGKWMQILQEGESSNGRVVEDSIPRPRYAHQVVYDPKTRTVFMHGGNAGIGGGGMERRGETSGSGSGMDGEDGEESVESREGSGGDGKERGKERRLDDFWCMKLHRPAAGEIIRQATYQIRRQQFREMCEEMPPVKALNFLQTEVSATVDHTNPEEAESFRALLSHLLTPTPTTPSHSRTPSSASRGSKSGHIVDVPPRKKRTRPNTPVGTWTNKLDEDEIMSDFTRSVTPLVSAAEQPNRANSINAQVLRAVEDVEELKTRDEVTAVVSGIRYAQRTEVFEELLMFIAEENKQPPGSLLDLVDRDDDT